ncbi:MAG: FAD-dependent monooxygenase [Gemmatimonadota bacterium]|jgi:putative flavoprotein involved in K+ transport
MDDAIDVLVIGAGQAGLAVSRLLATAPVRHVVLERGRTGESWRSQRWDSFHLDTPAWSNCLPGMEFGLAAPDSFGHRDEIVSCLERYARTFDLPVREHTTVTLLERLPSVTTRQVTR